METEILLVRHGQTAWNLGETDPAAPIRFRGRADIPLSEVGREEVAALARRIAAEYKPVAVYSSPLRRARETAEAVADATDCAICPAPGLVDVAYGAWQGLTAEEAEARDPEAFRRWRAAADDAAVPGGERLRDVAERAWRELEIIADSHEGASVVAVSHDVPCALLLVRMLGLPLSDYRRAAQRTAALSLLVRGERGWQIRFRDDARHLEKLHGKAEKNTG